MSVTPVFEDIWVSNYIRGPFEGSAQGRGTWAPNFGFLRHRTKVNAAKNHGKIFGGKLMVFRVTIFYTLILPCFSLPFPDLKKHYPHFLTWHFGRNRSHPVETEESENFYFRADCFTSPTFPN